MDVLGTLLSANYSQIKFHQQIDTGPAVLALAIGPVLSN